jgi:hypothetical protein
MILQHVSGRQLALVLTLVMLAPATALRAQEHALGGRVVGPDGDPLAGQPVILHRVAAGSGATIAADTTDADGRFLLRFEAGATGDDAAYFVAARWQGELYIGPPFRTPIDTTADYTMQVGVPGTSASQLLGSAQAPPRPVAVAPRAFPYRAWLLLIIPLLLAALIAGYLLTRGRGAVRRRRLLLDVALLDETYERELAQGDITDSTLYWAERRNLLERLTHES